MNHTSRMISTYSADVFGVCSALFELGGMVIMHDASGCNSTYTTHDEPRWYDMESMVYISGLSEMEAIMGDDEKLIDDIVSAAQDLHPRFIAVAGTPIPTMTGFDFTAVAELIEQRTGIPAFGFPTTGMNTYVHGAGMALSALAERFVLPGVTKEKTVNLLGLTPLDFSVNGSDASLAEVLEQHGWHVQSSWAMGSSLEEISASGDAQVNLVVSAAGLGAARVLQRRFGIPYVVGIPYGRAWTQRLLEALETAAAPRMPELDGEDIVIIGEGVTSVSLACAIELETHRSARVLCSTECDSALLRRKDHLCRYEDELEAALHGAKCIIADPLFQPICPKDAAFLPLPAESFSGRIYRAQIPNLIADFEKMIREVSL